MPTDPVCGEVFTDEEAETLGAEKVESAAGAVWFCGPYCRDMYLRDPAKYAVAKGGHSH